MPLLSRLPMRPIPAKVPPSATNQITATTLGRADDSCRLALDTGIAALYSHEEVKVSLEFKIVDARKQC